MGEGPYKHSIINEHPCFGIAKCGTYGRIHLPVAPKCNIKCRYCDRKYDCVSESRPGVCSKIMSPGEALDSAKKVLETKPRIRVVGIAGPGESLANDETFETLDLVRRGLPGAILCLSTNGLLLKERIDDLKNVGVDTVTVTVNAIHMSAAEKIYSYISYQGHTLPGEEGIRFFLERQAEGLSLLFDAHIPFKINTVLIPGINDKEIESIALLASSCNAEVMNVIPLIPCSDMVHLPAPTALEISDARDTAAHYLRQFKGCQRCRADACGLV